MRGDLWIVIKHNIAQKLKKLSKFNYFYYDIINKYKYGPDAPIFAERIWINPADCMMAIDKSIEKWGRGMSGRVIESPWPQQICPIMEVEKIRACFEHWVDDVPWEDTCRFKTIKATIASNEAADGRWNMKDIFNRYEKIEAIFNQVRKENRIRTRRELDPNSFRELGGICIHIGPEGELFFGNRGSHRFAMSLILKLPLIPAQIGCVHVRAIPFLPNLRRNHKNLEL